MDHSAATAKIVGRDKLGQIEKIFTWMGEHLATTIAHYSFIKVLLKTGKDPPLPDLPEKPKDDCSGKQHDYKQNISSGSTPLIRTIKTIGKRCIIQKSQ